MNVLLTILFFLFPQEDPSTLQAVFDTSAGQFIIEFYPNEAPNHVRKFIELARAGFYNGTTFHSVVQLGIVQAGDLETMNQSECVITGSGGVNTRRKQDIM